MIHVFVSYSPKDENLAKKLVLELSKFEVNVKDSPDIDSRVQRWGNRIAPVKNKLRDCPDGFIAVLSRAYVSSDSRVLELALACDLKYPIFLVLSETIDEWDWPPCIQNLPYHDLRSLGNKGAFHTKLDELVKEISQRKQEREKHYISSIPITIITEIEDNWLFNTNLRDLEKQGIKSKIFNFYVSDAAYAFRQGRYGKAYSHLHDAVKMIQALGIKRVFGEDNGKTTGHEVYNGNGSQQKATQGPAINPNMKIEQEPPTSSFSARGENPGGMSWQEIDDWFDKHSELIDTLWVEDADADMSPNARSAIRALTWGIINDEQLKDNDRKTLQKAAELLETWGDLGIPVDKLKEELYSSRDDADKNISNLINTLNQRLSQFPNGSNFTVKIFDEHRFDEGNFVKTDRKIVKFAPTKASSTRE